MQQDECLDQQSFLEGLLKLSELTSDQRVEVRNLFETFSRAQDDETLKLNLKLAIYAWRGGTLSFLLKQLPNKESTNAWNNDFPNLCETKKGESGKNSDVSLSPFNSYKDFSQKSQFKKVYDPKKVWGDSPNSSQNDNDYDKYEYNTVVFNVDPGLKIQDSGRHIQGVWRKISGFLLNTRLPQKFWDLAPRSKTLCKGEDEDITKVKIFWGHCNKGGEGEGLTDGRARVYTSSRKVSEAVIQLLSYNDKILKDLGVCNVGFARIRKHNTGFIPLLSYMNRDNDDDSTYDGVVEEEKE